MGGKPWRDLAHSDPNSATCCWGHLGQGQFPIPGSPGWLDITPPTQKDYKA